MLPYCIGQGSFIRVPCNRVFLELLLHFLLNVLQVFSGITSQNISIYRRPTIQFEVALPTYAYSIM